MRDWTDTELLPVCLVLAGLWLAALVLAHLCRQGQGRRRVSPAAGATGGPSHRTTSFREGIPR
jgi:hypothetical protein